MNEKYIVVNFLWWKPERMVLQLDQENNREQPTYGVPT